MNCNLDITRMVNNMCNRSDMKVLYYDPEYDMYIEPPIEEYSIVYNENTYSEYYRIWLNGRYSIMADEVLNSDSGKCLRRLSIVVYTDGTHSYRDYGRDNWLDYIDWTWYDIMKLRPDVIGYIPEIAEFMNDGTYQYTEAWKYDEDFWDWCMNTNLLEVNNEV